MIWKIAVIKTLLAAGCRRAQTCCGSVVSAAGGCRCWDSRWQKQASDVIDMSEAKRPEQPLHINPPCSQAYKYQHSAGWPQTTPTSGLRSANQRRTSRPEVSALSLQLRLLGSDAVQMFRPSCVLSVLVLQLLLDQTCSLVLPSRNRRVRLSEP